MTKSEERENEERHSSRNESHSYDWLEELSEDSGAPESAFEAGDDPDPGAIIEKKTAPMAADRDAGSDSAETSGSEEDKQEVVDLGNEIDLENDDLMWLDEMETVPDMNANPQEDNGVLPVESAGDSLDRLVEAEAEGEPADREAVKVDSDQVPDDPDEAIAWLERLAAKQGAPSEELPTVQSTVSVPVDEIAPPDPAAGLANDDTGEIPEDPDEAMAWLERLAARQGADADELTTVEPISEAAVPEAPEELEDELILESMPASLSEDLDEALGWLEELTIEAEPAAEEVEEADELPPVAVIEEPPTPAVAHDVESSLTGADLLFAEPEEVVPAGEDEEPFDESQIEDADDAMAWLEQLAARQGAPIEELTALDSDAEEDLVATEKDIQPIVEMEDQLDTHDELKAEEVQEASPAQEAPVSDEPVAEPVEVEGREEVGEVIAASEIAAADEAIETETGAEELAPEDAGVDALDAGLAVEEEVPAEDLAWLDTLGTVDAESWLESEATEEPYESHAELAEELAIETESDAGAKELETGPLPGILPDAPGSEELTLARQAMREGAVDKGLATYSAMVEKGEFLPFLIDDLETVSEEQGPEPGLQRVLGDAYARNGQLQKALQAYREALDNL